MTSDTQMSIEGVNIQWVRNLGCQAKVGHDSRHPPICFLDQNVLQTHH